MSLLSVEGLWKSFGPLKALNGVDFVLEPGETLGLVGESGSGKSTLARCILGLQKPEQGRVIFDGDDFLALKGRALQNKRAGIQMIFQDPYGSLNPRMKVQGILEEPFRIHNKKPTIPELLHQVGLDPKSGERFVHEFSGGQRQRIGIARALALSPKLILADEPVSALDVSVQSQILNLLKSIQKERGTAFLFIAHNLSVVQHMSHRIGVLYFGRLVELAPAGELYTNPRHPYTRGLLAAIPEIGKKRAHSLLQGDPPSPLNPPRGCPFHPRCPQATELCRTTNPALEGTSHKVACHHA
jgi:oligopeptide transport system ATP-binding protein